jgi:hypothetical protein
MNTLNLKDNDTTFVGGWSAANIAYAGFGQLLKVMNDPETLVRILVSCGQLGVALMTIYFFWRKARSIRTLRSRKKKKR